MKIVKERKEGELKGVKGKEEEIKEKNKKKEEKGEGE